MLSSLHTLHALTYLWKARSSTCSTGMPLSYNSSRNLFAVVRTPVPGLPPSRIMEMPSGTPDGMIVVGLGLSRRIFTSGTNLRRLCRGTFAELTLLGSAFDQSVGGPPLRRHHRVGRQPPLAEAPPCRQPSPVSQEKVGLVSCRRRCQEEWVRLIRRWRCRLNPLRVQPSFLVARGSFTPVASSSSFHQ